MQMFSGKTAFRAVGWRQKSQALSGFYVLRRPDLETVKVQMAVKHGYLLAADPTSVDNYPAVPFRLSSGQYFTAARSVNRDVLGFLARNYFQIQRSVVARKPLRRINWII